MLMMIFSYPVQETHIRDYVQKYNELLNKLTSKAIKHEYTHFNFCLQQIEQLYCLQILCPELLTIATFMLHYYQLLKH